MTKPPYPWWPRTSWRLNMHTGQTWFWDPVWRLHTWVLWRTGRGPRCGDYICDRTEHWPRGKVPADIVAFWEAAR